LLRKPEVTTILHKHYSCDRLMKSRFPFKWRHYIAEIILHLDNREQLYFAYRQFLAKVSEGNYHEILAKLDEQLLQLPVANGLRLNVIFHHDQNLHD